MAQIKKWVKKALPALRILLLIAAVVVLYKLVEKIGLDELLRILSQAALWMPVLVILEAVRIGLDAFATWLALDRPRDRLPISTLLAAQFIGTAVGVVAPAGRTSAEVVKASMLAPHVGSGPSTAAAAVNQAATLTSGGLITIPCAIAAWTLSGGSWISWALIAHTVILLAAGMAMLALMRIKKLKRWVADRFPKIAEEAGDFYLAANEQGVFASGPTLALFGSRVVQVIQFAILLHAVGISLSLESALVAQGLNMIALAAGSFVPAQVGVTDGAFVLSAQVLGTTEGKALSVALLVHALQAVFGVFGALLAVVHRK